jgi:23S rRNA pseudouridine1911/1915/1917 synthase
MQAEVVHADEHLVVINKPPGVSLATRRNAPQAAVARLLAALDDTQRDALGLGADSLLLVHRLDVGTSGLVVLARDADTHRGLVRAFTERTIEKTYLAVVWGRPRPAAGEWSWPLGPDRRDRRRMCVDPAGRSALSRYRVIGGPGFACLVVLSPATGRTHQLRVHLAHAGHPIVGDDLYGGPRHRGVRDAAVRRALQPQHPLLHAWRLVIPVPAGCDALRVEAPAPPSFLAATAALGVALPS